MAEGHRRGRRPARWGLALLGLALVAGLAFVALRAGPLAPVRVTVARVAVAPVQPALYGIGTVEARRSYLIGPVVAGRVRAVRVDVGDAVRAGQPLAEMDPVDLDERLRALDAAVARAGSAVAAAQAQRRDAQARRELSDANLRRYVDLGAQQFVSAGALESRRQEQASADAGLGAADAGLAAARQDLQRLGAERAALQQQRASLRLLAPAAGVVVSRDAEPGSTVVAGQPVLRLVDPGSLWVRVRLDQGRSSGLAQGLAAQVALRSDPSRPLPARVARLELLGDSVTEERMAQVAFDTPPPRLAIGELAEVTITLPATPAGPTLPNAALRRVDGRLGVWRLAAGGLQFVPVRTGAAGLDGRVPVLEGLGADDTVVLHSERAIGPRTRLRVVDALVDAAP